MGNLRIAGIVRESIVDGYGIRFVVFVQGCPHKCIGCHNPDTHSFTGGSVVDMDKIIDEIKKNPLLRGVTLSGGEPFCQAEELCYLAKKVHKLGLDITVYSGYTLEQLFELSDENNAIFELLTLCDVLIDGKFVLELRDLTLKFRGSGNQRIIDLHKSVKERKVVLLEDK